ncbi:MAG TPA: hypothetical protein ENK02_08365 [Planctomycetes bacterium]|nr:hypothetical protein [Planctomycetota bacterium]
MRKSFLILIATGILGMVAMAMMMNHLLAMTPDKKRDVDLENFIMQRFPESFEKRPRIYQEVDPEGGAEIQAKIYPKASIELNRLVDLIGRDLWKAPRKEGRTRSVVLSWKSPRTGRTVKTRVRRAGKAKVLRLYRHTER